MDKKKPLQPPVQQPDELEIVELDDRLDLTVDVLSLSALSGWADGQCGNVKCCGPVG